ncbi:lactose-binding lectin l-2 isoform X2 [Amia ocellicauda]|uniref:lactose-binding lectin l-2 isoform X2 n=1 Tax=Amia ocellicauda TaxID=2972642 RepID=UPI0034648D5B|nr:LADD protein [Amia calva]
MRALITALLCAALTLSALADDEHAAPGQSGGAHPEHAHTGDVHPGHGHAEGDHPAHGHDEHGHGHGHGHEHGHSGDAHPGHGHGHKGHFHRADYSKCGCPEEWTIFKDQCFEFIDHEKSWLDAELHCLGLGGNLASVHTEEEYKFLLQELHHHNSSNDKAWLGGSDHYQEGQWLWTDGSVWKYTHWSAGEPNNLEAHQDCLEMNFGDDHAWNDQDCSHTLPFICEMDRE